MSTNTTSASFSSGGSPDDDLGPLVVTLAWSLTAVSALFMGVRLYAKAWTGRGLWWDDIVLILAWLSVLTASIVSTHAVKFGLGRHFFTLTPDEAERTELLGNALITIYICGAGLSKTSFAMTILQVVSIHKWMRISTIAIIVSTNILLLVNIIILWIGAAKLNIDPVKGPTPEQSALSKAEVDYAIFVTAYSSAMDFALTGIGWALAMSLKLRNIREKIGVGIALTMGLLAGGTTIYKATVLPGLATLDSAYALVPVHIWSVTEATTTIMAVSIPVMRALFIQVKKRHHVEEGRALRRQRFEERKKPLVDVKKTPEWDSLGSTTAVTEGEDEDKYKTFYMEATRNEMDTYFQQPDETKILLRVEPPQMVHQAGSRRDGSAYIQESWVKSKGRRSFYRLPPRFTI